MSNYNLKYEWDGYMKHKTWEKTTEDKKANFSGGEWVATEKVHGSNFSFTTDGARVDFAKRTGRIKKTYFKKWQERAELKKEKVLQTFAYVKKQNPEMKKLQIICEFFGGKYPHDDVESITDIQFVQKEVWYCPDYEFFGFGIAINDEFCSFEKSRNILKANGWLVADILVKGTYEEVFAFEVEDFQTTIPEKLGLPPISDNWAEGIVLNEVRSTNRVKKKSYRFSELKQNRKFDKLVLPKGNGFEEELEKALCYLNSSRLDAVVSKFGRDYVIHEMNTCALVGLLLEDALQDLGETTFPKMKLRLGMTPEAEKVVNAWMNSNKRADIFQSMLEFLDKVSIV